MYSLCSDMVLITCYICPYISLADVCIFLVMFISIGIATPLLSVYLLLVHVLLELFNEWVEVHLFHESFHVCIYSPSY